MTLQIFRDNHQPGRIFIKSMDNPCTRKRFKGGAIVQQTINQSTLMMTRCRMDDKFSLFIKHEQLFIFIDDTERHFFGGPVLSRL